VETSSFQNADQVIATLRSKIIQKKKPVVSGVSPIMEHKLSHQTIMAQFIRIAIDFSLLNTAAKWKRSKKSELNKFGFPKLIVNYYKKYLH
jgi:hypothetical protein